MTDPGRNWNPLWRRCMGPELHLGHDPIDVLVLHVAHLIVSWCFYHPIKARLYFVSAIPLLWAGKDGSGDWVTRGVLVFFVILIATLFGKTMHKICWWIISWLSLLADLVHLLIFKGFILTPP